MKIVSLLPSATEIVYALDLGDQLSAVTHECDYPPEAALKPVITRSVLPHGLSSGAIDAAVRGQLDDGAYLTAKALNKLVSTLKAWPLGTVRHVPLERGEVVAGGIALDEVDSSTMRSKRIGGLFLCGEVLDIAGPVGGYNLQAAWSTGWVAGEAAARG